MSEHEGLRNLVRGKLVTLTRICPSLLVQQNSYAEIRGRPAIDLRFVWEREAGAFVQRMVFVQDRPGTVTILNVTAAAPLFAEASAEFQRVLDRAPEAAPAAGSR
jgi:hypothetical protein